jgi:ribosomal protein S28E/S33
MRRSGLFSARLALALLPLLAVASAAFAQPALTREGDSWVRTFSGNGPAAPRLRVNANGPVTLQGGVSRNLSYQVKVSVKTRTAAEALRILERYAVRLAPQGDWQVLTAPGGPFLTAVSVKAPRLTAAVVSTSGGAVDVRGVDGPLVVSTGGGELSVDRIRGRCQLSTVGGDVRVGEVDGSLECASGAGRITVGTVRGEAVLSTEGGDIEAAEVDGPVRAQTLAGGIHIAKAGATVTATTGGGRIIVDSANGIVITRNMAGPIEVGAAAGVESESGAGGVRLGNILGSMQVSTTMGSIMASLLGGKLADSFLATGDGDITVLIPSNVGVTIRAESQMADTLRRIVSEFPAIPVRREGTGIVAEGPVNGGGPLLRISATQGTIFIKRQP